MYDQGIMTTYISDYAYGYGPELSTDTICWHDVPVVYTTFEPLVIISVVDLHNGSNRITYSQQSDIYVNIQNNYINLLDNATSIGVMVSSLDNRVKVIGNTIEDAYMGVRGYYASILLVERNMH